MSSGKTKTFSVSGASTPLTAVAIEPLSITEPAPPTTHSKSKSSSRKLTRSNVETSQTASKPTNEVKKETVSKDAAGESTKDSVEVVTTAAAEPQDVLPETAPHDGSPPQSSKASLASSISSSAKPPQNKLPSGASPWGLGLASGDQAIQSQQQSIQRTPSPKDKRKDVGSSGKKYNREALLEEYAALQKERKALRKRNLQAQTNIAQYMRKHRYVRHNIYKIYFRFIN